MQNSLKETKKPACFVPSAQKAGRFLSSLVHIDFLQQIIHCLICTHLLYFFFLLFFMIQRYRYPTLKIHQHFRLRLIIRGNRTCFFFTNTTGLVSIVPEISHGCIHRHPAHLFIQDFSFRKQVIYTCIRNRITFMISHKLQMVTPIQIRFSLIVDPSLTYTSYIMEHMIFLMNRAQALHLHDTLYLQLIFSDIFFILSSTNDLLL